MLMRGKPRDKSNFYIASDIISRWLQKQGFNPKYFDGENYYYKKNVKLIETLKGVGMYG